MKKIYLAAISMMCGLAAIAQPTITQANHSPVNGDQFGTYQCDSLNILPGGNGANQTWNFSSLVTHSNIATNYTAIVNTNPSYTNANITYTSGGYSTAYYETGATSHRYWGGNSVMGGASVQITCTTPAVYMAYPFSLNSTTASVFSGSIIALGNSGTFNGSCSVNAGATGTMMLPGISYTSVIRVLNSTSLTFTIQGIPGTANQNLYEFYSVNDFKFPILSINQSTVQSQLGTSAQTIVTVLKNSLVTGIMEDEGFEPVAFAFPNPASQDLSFYSNAAGAIVTVYDLTGRSILVDEIKQGQLKVDVANYPAGLYLYKITGHNGRTFKTGKLTVTH